MQSNSRLFGKRRASCLSVACLLLVLGGAEALGQDLFPAPVPPGLGRMRQHQPWNPGFEAVAGWGQKHVHEPWHPRHVPMLPRHARPQDVHIPFMLARDVIFRPGIYLPIRSVQPLWPRPFVPWFPQDIDVARLDVLRDIRDELRLIRQRLEQVR